MTRDNAERIAAAAGVRVEWLLCDDDFMTTEEIEETARKAQEKAEWSAFDLSSKILALDNAFEKATGVKLNYQIVGRRAGDIVKVWADPKLANEELGWKAEVGIEDTLRSAWNWQLKLRERGIQ